VFCFLLSAGILPPLACGGETTEAPRSNDSGDQSRTDARPPPPLPTGCFGRGTPVATPTGEVPIEQIRIGTLVLAYDLSRRRVIAARVLDTLVHEAQRVMELVPRDRSPIRVTPNHPIYALGAGSFWAAGELEGPAAVLALDSSASASVSWVDVFPSLQPDVATVYDLTVDAVHNYFAGGILVHNKSRCGYPGDPPDCPCITEECRPPPRDAADSDAFGAEGGTDADGSNGDSSATDAASERGTAQCGPLEACACDTASECAGPCVRTTCDPTRTLCTDPRNGSCECGAFLDDRCSKPASHCLCPRCGDATGVCVTLAQELELCSGEFRNEFDCP
jgi:hypothetical protein